MKNRGQVLVSFLLLLPILGIFLGFLFDLAYLGTEKRKMENVGKEAIRYGFQEKQEESIKSYLEQNLEDFELKNLKFSEHIISFKIKKKVKSNYSILTGKKIYTISISFEGTLEDGKIIITKE